MFESVGLNLSLFLSLRLIILGKNFHRISSEPWYGFDINVVTN